MTDSQPPLTIGLPVFNGGAYLEKAIRSLLGQSFRDYELIISDNASTDETQKICENFKKQDERIRYVRQPFNRGPIWNYNFVLKEAKSEYFMWASDDDFWDKDWVLKLMGNFGDSVSISFGHVVNVDSDGKIIRTFPPFQFIGPRIFRLIRFYLVEGKKGKPNIIYGIHRTKTLQRIGLKIYNNSRFGFDMHLVFNCLQYGTIRTDQSVLLYKRLVDPGGSGEKEKHPRSFPLTLLSQMVRYYYSYLFIPERFQDKMIIALFFPVKLMKGLVYNLFAKH